MWCNGDCMWLNGECQEPTFWGRLWELTHTTFWLWYHSIPICFLIALVMAAYAIVYKKKVVEEIPAERIENNDDPDFDAWEQREVGLFECFKYPSQCLWATFCAPVVAGKNFSTTGVLPFWPSCCLVFIGIFTLFWPIFCMMAIVRTILSGKLQRNLNFKPNCCVNLFVNLFCFPCEIGRESIEVDNALGVEIKCPFEVEKSLGARLEMMEESVDRTCTRVCS